MEPCGFYKTINNSITKFDIDISQQLYANTFISDESITYSGILDHLKTGLSFLTSSSERRSFFLKRNLLPSSAFLSPSPVDEDFLEESDRSSFAIVHRKYFWMIKTYSSGFRHHIFDLFVYDRLNE